MLLSDQLFKRKLVKIVGTLSQKTTVAVLEDIAGHIEQFLAIQILTSAAVAIVTGVALWTLGMHLVSRASSMNQVAVFVGLLFWSWAWGVWGMLLAVPMMMVVKVVCDRVEPLNAVGHLLGD